MKRMLLIVILLLIAVAAGLYWLRGNLDGLVKSALISYASEMTQASVQVAGVEIRTTNGQGTIRGLMVGNPAGFKTAYAFKADTIELEVELASITKDVVLIKRVAVLAPDVIYEKGDVQTNFDALQKNIADYLGPSKKKDGAKRYIVQEFTIRGAKAQAHAAFLGDKTVAVNLPDLTLHDLGKAKGGMTAGELGQEITGALKQKLTGAISFDGLMKSMGNVLDKTGSAIKGLFK